MACWMIVQLPVTGAFGSDADFDLRTLLERELGAALTAAQVGKLDHGEIEDGRMNICMEAIVDPARTLHVVKDVLARSKQLHRAMIVLETRYEADPDDIDQQILWPLHPAPVHVA